MQAAIAAAFAITVAIFADGHKGLSAAIGGTIAVIGSLMYAMIIAGKTGDATSIMKAHFRAEMVKIFITVVLFILVLLLFHTAAMLWLILGFAAATLTYWVALLTV